MTGQMSHSEQCSHQLQLQRFNMKTGIVTHNWTKSKKISTTLKEKNSPAMLTLQPLHKLSTMQHPCSCPTPRRWLLSDLFVPLPPSSLPPDGSVSVDKHHGRSGSRAQRAQAFSVVVEKQPSGERPFVSFQNYQRVFKADRCCVYPVVYHSSQSWVVVLGNATGLRLDSRRYVLTLRVSLMPRCNITSPIKTYRGYMPFSGKSDKKWRESATEMRILRNLYFLGRD